jgi:uncharacterized lipoprotein YajG
MKIIFLLTVASLFLAGCSSHPSDASIRRHIVGTWTPTPSNTVTVFADGSYKDVHADATIEGTWTVDGGFWTLTTTNISGTFKGARVGQVVRFEVVRIGEHELACHLIGGIPEIILIAKKP